jgi:hypothetical protein
VGRFGITMRQTFVDVKVTLADAVKVRVQPQPEYNDKGKPIPFKPDPKDPDRRLGGARGSPDDVRKDTWVVAQISRTRSGSKHVASVIMVLGEEQRK